VASAETNQAAPNDWLVVILEDGTELEMTNEHPIFPLTNDDFHQNAGLPVRAADLKPRYHCLEVLKKVPVVVQDVKALVVDTTSGECSRDAPLERVAVSVHQADRHSIFVASAAGRASVAVASASVAPDQASLQHLLVKNTFIDGFNEEEYGNAGTARSSSAPPIVQRSEFRSQPKVLSLQNQLSSEVGSTHELRRTSSRTSLTSSYASTFGSTASKPTMIQLTNPGFDEARTLPNSLGLRAVMEMQAKGCASLGSTGHNQGKCAPCLMQSLYHKGKFASPCRFGKYCGRCHEHHTESTQSIKSRIKKLRQEGKV
jgi:hypothetical protein